MIIIDLATLALCSTMFYIFITFLLFIIKWVKWWIYHTSILEWDDRWRVLSLEIFAHVFLCNAWTLELKETFVINCERNHFSLQRSPLIFQMTLVSVGTGLGLGVANNHPSSATWSGQSGSLCACKQEKRKLFIIYHDMLHLSCHRCTLSFLLFLHCFQFSYRKSDFWTDSGMWVGHFFLRAQVVQSVPNMMSRTAFRCHVAASGSIWNFFDWNLHLLNYHRELRSIESWACINLWKERRRCLMKQ